MAIYFNRYYTELYYLVNLNVLFHINTTATSVKHSRFSRFRTTTTNPELGIAEPYSVYGAVLLESLKIPMLDRHTLMEKMDVSRVSTHHRDDEVEETKTISSLSGRLSETKQERFERE